MLARIIHRECSSPQQCSSAMSKGGFSSSQQDGEFQSKSHRPVDGQQFRHHGIQMSKITTDHMGEASEKVNRRHYKTSLLISGMSTLLSLLPFTSPVLRLVFRKGWHRKTKSQSDSDDCDNEANVNAVTLKMWFHQMILACWESRGPRLWHTEDLQGHWAIFQGQTVTQWSQLCQTDMFYAWFVLEVNSSEYFGSIIIFLNDWYVWHIFN